MIFYGRYSHLRSLNLVDPYEAANSCHQIHAPNKIPATSLADQRVFICSDAAAQANVAPSSPVKYCGAYGTAAKNHHAGGDNSGGTSADGRRGG